MILARVVIGISGASGAAIGVRIVERLAATERFEVHLVVSHAGERTLAHEVGPDSLSRLTQLVHRRHDIADIGATIASGSFRTAGMIIAPCSAHSLSAIAYGAADNLLIRAADVHLKERRRVVLLLRESPLHLGHIRAMAQVTEIGAVVAPVVPAFYLNPATIADVVDQLAARAIDLLGVKGCQLAREYNGETAQP